MKSRFAFALCLLACLGASAALAAGERHAAETPGILYGGNAAAKATTDTIVLMGPGGLYPFRGDFETASPRPGGDGLLTDGWTSTDATAPANHWHVDTFNNPGSGNGAWCGSAALASCGAGDVAGGYGNNWRDALEFRRTVTGAATVRVQAVLRYDTEPGYDYVTLQRRTAGQPQYEPVATGQGLSWDGQGTATVDFTFAYSAAELVDGTDIAVAFIFDSDGGWSDGDCLWPTAGAAVVDDITVTVDDGTPVVRAEDFEDNDLGPDWRLVPNTGVGDFARVWSQLGDLDPCFNNYTNQVAFIDDGLVVPGTGGTVGLPGYDYGPPGGWVVNYTGGLLGSSWHLDNWIDSPVMPVPAGGNDGLTFAFDVYKHELLGVDSPGIMFAWRVRSAVGDDIAQAPWMDRNFVYYGGPRYDRFERRVDDLLTPGATHVQVSLGVMEIGWWYCFCDGDQSTPAPYFDNVNVKVYPGSGPRIVATEMRLANDGFPASGIVDLQNLGANSVRFDMAANISVRTHLRNDPGDSIYVDVTPRQGAVLAPPVMHWTFAVQNPLFDAYRTLPPATITGRVTRSAAGAVLANRWNFDLPDTGMLFPGDILHYWFEATDSRGGDVAVSTLPEDLSAQGNPALGAWPEIFTVRCLPSVRDYGFGNFGQPRALFWNDAGLDDLDAWAEMIRTVCWLDVDVYSTTAAAAGVGNGLGGRATPAQLSGYSSIYYTSGALGARTLSPGDFNMDPGNDIGLLETWLAQGERNLFVCGDDLAADLASSGAAATAFLQDRLGLAFIDQDVRPRIGGQYAPLVLPLADNPVFGPETTWVAYGGCPDRRDFDTVQPAPGAQRLAQYTAVDGVSTPYPYAVANLKESGTSRVVTLAHDLLAAVDPPGSPSNWDASTAILWDVAMFLELPTFVPGSPPCISAVPGAPAARFAVTSQPNPFNPSVVLRYTLARPGHVTMKVFDARGALVRTLLDGPVAETSGSVTWRGDDDGGRHAASGLYFVETRADGQVDVRKVTMLK